MSSHVKSPFDIRLFHFGSKSRWAAIILLFALIAILDFSTPSDYILAYLYTVPILLSISFLKPRIAKSLLALAVLATLLNLVLPNRTVAITSVLINRILAALAIIISSFFMIRYIRYQARIQEQEKRLNTERQLSQVREDFIATLTHDLKTPLIGGQKTLQHLTDGAFGPISPDQKQVLEALLRSNNRQAELVESLLNAYRNDHIGVDLKMVPVDMDELTADTLTELQALATDRHLTLEYACRQTPSKIQGDPVQLKRVLANLLHNALNYTPSGGTVQVNLVEQLGQLQVSVSDTGPGLSKQDLEQVFHRFYRADSTRQLLGTGLGLYLSRQLIHAHRGKIWAENRSPHGCAFIFTLPVAAGETQS